MTTTICILVAMMVIENLRHGYYMAEEFKSAK